MFRALFLILLFTISLNSYCQTWGDTTVLSDNDIFLSVNKAPKFPRGIKGLYEFFSQHLKKPVNDKTPLITRYVILKIVINKEGKVVWAEIEKGINASYNQVAIDVIKLMPNWTPGMQNGKPVYCYQIIPLVFVDG